MLVAVLLTIFIVSSVCCNIGNDVEIATYFGQIGEYQEGIEEWMHYSKPIKHYLAANGIKSMEKKRSMFLSLIGPKMSKLSGD